MVLHKVISAELRALLCYCGHGIGRLQGAQTKRSHRGERDDDDTIYEIRLGERTTIDVVVLCTLF